MSQTQSEKKTYADYGIYKETLDKTGWNCGCYDYYGNMYYCDNHSRDSPPPYPLNVKLVWCDICGMAKCLDLNPNCKICDLCHHC